jgi:hypothetical protein
MRETESEARVVIPKRHPVKVKKTLMPLTTNTTNQNHWNTSSCEQVATVSTCCDAWQILSKEVQKGRVGGTIGNIGFGIVKEWVDNIDAS